MSPDAASSLIGEFSKRYPALITLQQAAEIAQVPIGTVYDYSSRGLFDGFKVSVGRYRRLVLTEFVNFLISNNDKPS